MTDHDCYCTALRKAARRVTSRYDQALQPVGVNLAQFSLLRKIGKHPNISLTELGDIVELDRSTIGRNVKVLERMSLVKISTGRDQREATVSLEHGGVDVLDRGDPIWAETQSELEKQLGGNGAASLLVQLAAL